MKIEKIWTTTDIYSYVDPGLGTVFMMKVCSDKSFHTQMLHLDRAKCSIKLWELLVELSRTFDTVPTAFMYKSEDREHYCDKFVTFEELTAHHRAQVMGRSNS